MSVAQQALKDLGIPIETYYASEIDKYAIAVTQSNFPETVQLGDVSLLHFDEVFRKTVVDIDLMIGGSPCQDLSIAKKNREGLKGARSGLFYEYVRIRDEVNPKYFILENVASMPKEAKETISEALGVEPVMINADLVSAQNRKRLFWVGKWNGEKYEQVEIPQPEDRGILLKDVVETSENIVYQNRHRIEEKCRINKSGKCPTLLSAMGTGGDNVPYVTPVALRNRGEGKKPEYNNTGRANALTSVQTDSMVQDNTQIRKLTPTECLRLQSMPDDYFDKATCNNKPISNTQRYKMCGNAFNCEVIKHIIKNLDFDI